MDEQNFLVKLYVTNFIPGKGRGYLFTLVEKGVYIYVIQFHFMLPKLIDNRHQIISKSYNLEYNPNSTMQNLNLDQLNKLNIDFALEVWNDYLISEFEGNYPISFLDLIELNIEKEKLFLQIKYRKEVKKISKDIYLDHCKAFLERLIENDYKFYEKKED
jgi:hypothetical protein